MPKGFHLAANIWVKIGGSKQEMVWFKKLTVFTCWESRGPSCFGSLPHTSALLFAILFLSAVADLLLLGPEPEYLHREGTNFDDGQHPFQKWGPMNNIKLCRIAFCCLSTSGKFHHFIAALIIEAVGYCNTHRILWAPLEWTCFPSMQMYNSKLTCTRQTALTWLD